MYAMEQWYHAAPMLGPYDVASVKALTFIIIIVNTNNIIITKNQNKNIIFIINTTGTSISDGNSHFWLPTITKLYYS